MARWGDVLTAMVTPFTADGALDVDAAVDLARWLSDNGNSGFVIAGTTGEGTTLSDDERHELFSTLAASVTVPVIAGAGTNDTRHSIHLTRMAQECGVAAVLAVTPYYNRPSQAGLEAHFRAVAGATDLPVMLYDIPVRTGRKISHDVLVRLARDVPNIVAVKDAALDVGASARLAAAVGEDLEIYSGNDDQTLPLLAVGAVGVVGVATHWCGNEMAEMIAAFKKGDVVTARRINARLLDSFSFESTEAAPNPVPAKAMLRVMGRPVGECRLPMGPEPAGLEDRAREVLAEIRG